MPGEPVTIGETKVRFELFTKAGTYGLPVSRAGENESVVDSTTVGTCFSRNRWNG